MFKSVCDRIYLLEGLVPNVLTPQQYMECLAYDDSPHPQTAKRNQKKAVEITLLLWLSYPLFCFASIGFFVFVLIRLSPTYNRFMRGAAAIENLVEDVAMSKAKVSQVIDLSPWQMGGH